MALYSTACIVNYEVSGNDELLSSLLLMEEYDEEFSQQLLCDDYIQNIFTLQLEHKISKGSKERLPVKLGIALIVRGLKNRARFAIRQKERLKSHVGGCVAPARIEESRGSRNQL